MKTTVKYSVLKSLDYQLGTPLFQEEIEADGQYFDQIPSIIHYQNLKFKVKSKELKPNHYCKSGRNLKITY